MTRLLAPTTNPVVIATHNGSFHADDVFGVAVLQMLFPNNTVIRTRDQAKIVAANFAVDVGGVWDAELGRFDHHQKGFVGARDNGVVYASAGLVWAAYGEHCLRLGIHRRHISESDIQRVTREIDEELVQHLDRADTGVSMGAPGLFGLSALLSQFNPTWLEESCLSVDEREALKLARFNQAVEFTESLLSRIIADKVSEAAAANLILNSRRPFDGRVLLLGGSGMPWHRVVIDEMPEVLFVVYPDSSDTQYQVRTVPVEHETFVARADLPYAWAGLRDAELAKVTGVADAAFCHNGCFIAGAYSLDGALRLAELALLALADESLQVKPVN